MESHWLDICLLVPLAWGLIRGIFKGLVLSVGSLLGLFLGIFIANAYADDVAKAFTEWFTLSGTACYVIAFLVIFVGVSLLTFIVAKVLDRFLAVITLAWLNRTLGAIFGLLKYALILSVILNLFDSVGNYINIIPEASKEKSILYRPVQKFLPAIMPYVNFYLGDDGKSA